MRRSNIHFGRLTRRLLIPLGARLKVLKTVRDRLRAMPRRYLYPWLGGCLAQGAPLGLLWTRAFEDQKSSSLLDALALLDPRRSSWLIDELVADRNAYVYLMFFSTALLTILGLVLGMQEDRLRLLATTDALTGLMNRRHFAARLRQELSRARRYQVPLSLLVIDLDWLKAINDGHGHSAGDRAIGAVATTLRNGLRNTDLAARYAGDEFAALLPETRAQEAVGLARRLGEEVGKVALGPHGRKLSISIGVADLATSHAATAEDLFVAADEALYRAKAAGKNSVAVAEEPAIALLEQEGPASGPTPDRRRPFKV